MQQCSNNSLDVKHVVSVDVSAVPNVSVFLFDILSCSRIAESISWSERNPINQMETLSTSQ